MIQGYTIQHLARSKHSINVAIIIIIIISYKEYPLESLSLLHPLHFAGWLVMATHRLGAHTFQTQYLYHNWFKSTFPPGLSFLSSQA